MWAIYDDHEPFGNFNKNALYHFDFIGGKLVIGNFCQISINVRFIMNGANHAIGGFSVFPFCAFGNSWQGVPLTSEDKGDIVTSNDVWVGYNTIIVPGMKIGASVIIASGSIITKDVAPYSIVGSNPAMLIRKRFD